ncbi:MAG: LamG-like jellyroll fold domain-containing protein [Limisphaerales bacterium]
MKAINRGNGFSRKLNHILTARALIVAGLLFCAISGLAQPLPGGKLYPSYTPLDSWSFNDTTNWTSGLGYAPVSFTNITGLSWFGDGTSLGLNTNTPAWLQYNVIENDGITNLTVDVGSVAFWFAPAWAGTNEGGTGPGLWGRLIEVGGYTDDASFGWWSLYVDDVGANLYFTVQPGDGSTTTYLTAPIAWTTNYWHFITLTYCATNMALYLDGALATNGPGITAWPDSSVLAGGFYIGSDSNGVIQA